LEREDRARQEKERERRLELEREERARQEKEEARQEREKEGSLNWINRKENCRENKRNIGKKWRR